MLSNTNGYLVYLFQVVSRLKLFFKKNSQVVSRSTHKWYPTSGTHEDSKCSRNGFIDKTIIHVVSYFYTWYHSYKMVVSQVILNFKWSSSKECFSHPQELKISEWPMLGHRGRSPTTIGIKVTRSYTWCLKVSIKNKDSSVNHLPHCKPLHQWEAHLLWKLMTKGKILYKDMKALGEIETKK